VRQGYVEVAGVRQPAPAPRFSRTPGSARPAPSRPGVDGEEILESFGIAPAERAALRAAKIIA
jgi:alpha-methylacyl-CoA racemase